MTARKPPSRGTATVFGKGSAAKQQARKNAHHQPFRDKLAALQDKEKLEAEVADALARALERAREEA